MTCRNYVIVSVLAFMVCGIERVCLSQSEDSDWDRKRYELDRERYDHQLQRENEEQQRRYQEDLHHSQEAWGAFMNNLHRIDAANQAVTDSYNAQLRQQFDDIQHSSGGSRTSAALRDAAYQETVSFNNNKGWIQGGFSTSSTLLVGTTVMAVKGMEAQKENKIALINSLVDDAASFIAQEGDDPSPALALVFNDMRTLTPEASDVDLAFALIDASQILQENCLREEEDNTPTQKVNMTISEAPVSEKEVMSEVQASH